MKYLTLSAALVLAGCATQGRVHPLGPDTFMASAPALNPQIGRDRALTAANEQCKAMGKNIRVTSTMLERQTYEVVFLCLDANDPALSRPDLRPAPAVVIERRE